MEPPADPTLPRLRQTAEPDRSRPVRIVFAVVGTVALAFGILGFYLLQKVSTHGDPAHSGPSFLLQPLRHQKAHTAFPTAGR